MHSASEWFLYFKAKEHTMHRGRFGRRVPQQCLSLDATPPYFAWYWMRPLAFTFVHFGIPIVGPLGQPYVSPTLPLSLQIHWEDTWVDPITGRAFRWTFDQICTPAQPGVDLSWSVDDFGGHFFGGTTHFSALGNWWSYRSANYAMTSPPHTLMYNLTFGDSNYQAADWASMP